MLAKCKTTNPPSREFATLLRGDESAMLAWSEQWSMRRFATHVGIVILGAGFYGAAMGWWRAPEQALFVAAKFPLILLLTALGNALINGMLAPLLGLNIPFRQSFSAVIMSFAITSAILGAFAPLIAFMTWNAPPMSPGAVPIAAYDFLLLAHVAAITLAGVTGNVRLFQLLAKLGGSRAVATRVLFAWLAGNLLLGSQLSWNLRPFIGSPGLPVEFFRQNAFQGNFFEAVFHALQQLLQ